MSKSSFNTDTFAAKTFACGTLRGIGVVPPVVVVATPSVGGGRPYWRRQEAHRPLESIHKTRFKPGIATKLRPKKKRKKKDEDELLLLF